MNQTSCEDACASYMTAHARRCWRVSCTPGMDFMRFSAERCRLARRPRPAVTVPEIWVQTFSGKGSPLPSKPQKNIWVRVLLDIFRSGIAYPFIDRREVGTSVPGQFDRLKSNSWSTRNQSCFATLETANMAAIRKVQVRTSVSCRILWLHARVACCRARSIRSRVSRKRRRS